MSPRGACTNEAVSGHTARTRRAPRRMLPKAAASLALAIALAIGGSVHAATVRAVQGQVLVSAGQGYRLVDGSTQLGVGGTVVANPGAVAHVIYPGGCRVSVEPGSVYQIVSQPPCQTGETTKTGDLADNSTPSSGFNPWVIGAIGLAAGGGVAYAISSISP
jgi:hypothetical protein